MQAISYAMAMCTKALLRDPLVHHYESRKAPSPSAVESINDVITSHKGFWKHLCFQVALPKESVLPTPEQSRGLIIKEPQMLPIKIEKEDEDNSFNTTDPNSSYDSSSLNDSPRSDETVDSAIQDLETLSLNSDSPDKGCDEANKIAQHSDSKTVDTKASNVDSDNVTNVPDNKDGRVSNNAASSSAEAGPSSSSSGNGRKKQTLADYLAENMKVSTQYSKYFFIHYSLAVLTSHSFGIIHKSSFILLFVIPLF